MFRDTSTSFHKEGFSINNEEYINSEIKNAVFQHAYIKRLDKTPYLKHQKGNKIGLYIYGLYNDVGTRLGHRFPILKFEKDVYVNVSTSLEDSVIINKFFNQYGKRFSPKQKSEIMEIYLDGVELVFDLDK